MVASKAIQETDFLFLLETKSGARLANGSRRNVPLKVARDFARILKFVMPALLRVVRVEMKESFYSCVNSKRAKMEKAKSTFSNDVAGWRVKVRK
jgi:hypothetical protein